jgi:rubrerythrin
MSTDILEKLFLQAIQGEMNDRETYLSLAGRLEDSFLKAKLEFLAEEEEKHRVTLEEMYNAFFPGRDIVLPGATAGSVSDANVGENLELMQILEIAMDYELASQNNYLTLAGQLSDNVETSVTLTYFAAMEASHYGLLKIEKEHLEKLQGTL